MTGLPARERLVYPLSNALEDISLRSALVTSEKPVAKCNTVVLKPRGPASGISVST